MNYKKKLLKNLMSKGWTREQIEERRRQNQPTFDDDDDRNYQLEDEMLQYYRNKNFDRRTGRD